MRRTRRVHNLSERMSQRSHSSEKTVPRLLAGVVSLLILGFFWVILVPDSNSNSTEATLAGESSGGGSAESDATDATEKKPVFLNPDDFPPLPGEGPLRIAMRYLGEDGEAGFANEQLEQSLPGSISGRVTGPKFEPLPQVVLTIVGGPQDGLSCETDEQGHFRLLDLIPGTHFIRLATSDGGRYMRMQRIGSRGRTKRDFALGTSVDLPMAFFDHKGKPLMGATVEMDGRTFLTGADGVAWCAGAPAGPRVLVQIQGEGHVPVRFELNILPQRVAEPIQMPALPQGAVIRGQVKSWPGGELPRVTVVPRAIQPGPFQIVWETWQEVEVGADGFFELRGLPTDRMVDVRVFHAGGVASPRVRALRASTLHASVVEFTMTRGDARIAGVVLDAGGKPLRGAKVELKASDPAAALARLYPGLSNAPATVRLPVPAAIHRQAVTKRDGAFDFAWGDHPKGTGSLLLKVEADGYQVARREIRSGHSDLRLRLKPAIRSARLMLTAADDGPMPSAYLWIVDGETHETVEPQLGDLLPGWYSIAARRGDHDILAKRVYLGARTELAIR